MALCMSNELCFSCVLAAFYVVSGEKGQVEHTPYSCQQLGIEWFNNVAIALQLELNVLAISRPS